MQIFLFFRQFERTFSKFHVSSITLQFVEVLDLPGENSIEEIEESVDELREKLANMKRLMEERKGTTLGEISARKRKETSEIIDGNFLSWIFGSALIIILCVSFYAFYNLYHAVLKKFPAHHTEL